MGIYLLVAVAVLCVRVEGPHDDSLSEDAWHVRAEKPRFLDGLGECQGRAAPRLELRPRIEPRVDNVKGVADLFVSDEGRGHPSASMVPIGVCLQSSSREDPRRRKRP